MIRAWTIDELDRLAGLDPRFAPAARAVAEQMNAYCAVKKFGFKVTHGTRTFAEQDALFAKGRTVSSGIDVDPIKRPLGRTVTKARAGETAHNGPHGGFAIDGAFIFDRHSDYVTSDGYVPANDPCWTALGLAAEAHGLEWGGRWADKDWGHCQLPGWRALIGKP